MRLLLLYVFFFFSVAGSLFDINVSVIVCVWFFPRFVFVFRFFLFRSEFSLTHCVVSRSTSVIIITLALYFIWHAANSSPLDTFFYSRISF